MAIAADRLYRQLLLASMATPNQVRQVDNIEDYRDYQADKIMHEAMKLKVQGKGRTSEYQALVRKWADAQNA